MKILRYGLLQGIDDVIGYRELGSNWPCGVSVWPVTLVAKIINIFQQKKINYLRSNMTGHIHPT